MSNKKIVIGIFDRQAKDSAVRVMVESPLGGDLQENLIYARLAMRESMLVKKEAPMAFHLLYPQSLCDDNDEERKIGIFRSFVWHKDAFKKLFYLDRGFSNGMMLGYLNAIENGVETEFRTLSSNKEMNALIDDLNTQGSLSKEKLEAISMKFKDMMIINENLGIGLPGDVSSFRQEKEKELAAVKACTESYLVKEQLKVLLERLVMRDLLLKGEAPLNFPLLYGQFVSMNCDEAINACVSWNSVAESMIEVAGSNTADDLKAFSRNEIEIINRLNKSDYRSQERDFHHDMTA